KGHKGHKERAPRLEYMMARDALLARRHEMGRGGLRRVVRDRAHLYLRAGTASVGLERNRPVPRPRARARAGSLSDLGRAVGVRAVSRAVLPLLRRPALASAG